MQLIPAIDLLEGKAVRLHKGNYDAVTVYDDDPVGVAKRFRDAGAKRIHVVDLEGARAGEAVHVKVIERIVAEASVEVQVGGGIRKPQTAAQWLEAGAAGSVLGTAALERPEMVQRLAAECPPVIVAVDGRAAVATQGWLKDSDVSGNARTGCRSMGRRWLARTDMNDGTGVGPKSLATACCRQWRRR